jgi:hypothetical protein
MRAHRLHGFYIALTLTYAAQAIAQVGDAGTEAVKTAHIVRTDTPPLVDGRLDDAVWQRAATIDDFHQIRPRDGVPPSERTIVYLLYDDDNLYVGARMFDSDPSSISASVMTQGSGLGQDDRLSVIIDPFNTGRNGYRFETNPNGVRNDMLYKSVNRLSRDWTVIWEAQAARDEQGWTLEMAIPFKTLPFSPNIDTWGFNFARAIRRKGEEDVWVSRNRSYNPSIVGQVSGFSGMEQGLGLDIVPSVSLSERKTFSPGDAMSRTEPSLDVFYRVTPSLNASLTFNTDFSAAEVDDRQVNLTRFNLFFPEKRDFFLNDSDLFEFGRLGRSRDANQAASRASLENGRPFFSRRLGLSAAGTQVDLNYGGKLSGRVGRWTIGTLAVRQDQYESVNASNIFVGRVTADVLGESSVGAILTSGDPRSNVDNSLAGVDFQYLNTRLPGGRTLQAQAWYQQSRTEGLQGDDAAGGFGFNIPNATGFRGGVAVKEIQENFNPAVGFISRTGIRDYTSELGYTHFLSGNYLQSIFAGIDAQRINFISGGLQTQILVGRLMELESQRRDKLTLLYTANKEVVTEPFTIYEDLSRAVVITPGQYSFNDSGFDLETGNQREISGKLTYRDGDFYNGRRLNLGSELTWNPSRKLSFKLAYDWNNIALPQGDFITRLVQFTAGIAFSPTLSWVNLLQFDNVSNVLGINSRLHWIPKAGQEGFIVLNHNLQDIDKDGVFHSSLSDLNVKFNYTFRF